ncbi:hypothetical protein PUN28_002229 [Cardiocondyla obscurior]|uniref:Uncharacterized protein n=1 Tax=Cardiocondyla obscurior TaxID=286306 RepID=A0AAW2GT64_9HYME
MANLPFPAVMYIANNFFNIPPYLDDEEDEILSALIYFEVWKHKHKKLQLRIPKIDNFVERIVPQFNTNEFKSHFSGNDIIAPDKQFLLTLWRMATPDSYRYKILFILLVLFFLYLGSLFE